MPRPGLVVKNGSKILPRASSSMPEPVSSTWTTAYRPGASSPIGSSSALRVTTPVRTVSLPPASPMASRALVARLTSACSNRPGSSRTFGAPACGSIASSTSSPTTRRRRLSAPRTSAWRSITRGSSTCRRPMARSCWVSADARWPASWTSRTSAASAPPGGRSTDRSSQQPEDDREHVVEVVRDAAREPADRLEPQRLLQPLLGAAQGLLRRAPLAAVAEGHDRADDRPAVVQEGRGAVLDGDDRPLVIDQRERLAERHDSAEAQRPARSGAREGPRRPRRPAARPGPRSGRRPARAASR